MRNSVVLTLVTVSVTLAAAQQGSIKRLDGTVISAADAESFARKTLAGQHVTGAQLAVMNHGHLVWSGAFGLAGKNPDRPMDLETTTWAASITKGVFATYVLSLVERGEFDLDQPISQQLSKPLDEFDPYRKTAVELVKDPRWPAVTPRMLLSHSSGLANFAMFEPDKIMHLHHDPGVQYLYSGEGINLLQFVIEQKQGRPLDELMQTAIFTPLGMKRTGMIYRPELGTNVADRFDLNEKFHAQTKRFPARGAGSMTINAGDLATFLTALLANHIISAKTRAAMLKPVIPLRSLHQFAVGPGEVSLGEAAKVGLAYGLGWGLLTHTKFGPAFFKEGHGDGAQNYVICFERSRSCMILLTNSDNGELAFRPLLEHILGDTVTPWEWEGFTPAYVEASRKNP